MTMVFYDENAHPVAVMSRSTLGAQSWGRIAQTSLRYSQHL